MTTAYGIAAVTATLRELLNDGIVEHNLNGVLSSLVGVSTLPPDRVIPASGVEPTQLNLFCTGSAPIPAGATKDCPGAMPRVVSGFPMRRSRSICITCCRLTAPVSCTPRFCSAMPCSGCTKGRC
jgi:hypothetical protein